MTDGLDVLTLTATPIPRTLEMALTGIRDLSLINTPPAARQPILTYVGEFEEAAVFGGHPPGAAARGPGLLRPQPGAEHRGRGPPAAPAGPRGPGGDRPRSDGRGHARTGGDRLLGGPTTCWCAPPSSSRASTCPRSTPSWWTGPTCWAWASSTSCGAGWAGPGSGPTPTCFIRPTRSCPRQAYERLRTIGEHTELGSGFKIAMRDLEIRGAGNLLGRDQSGHIAAVGYDLYVQMVAEAVAEMKGEPVRPPVELKLDLPADAHLPADYVGRRPPARGVPAARRRTEQRARSTTSRTEWQDRFGPLPGPAAALLDVARLRVECIRLGVTDIAVTAPRTGMGRRAVTGPR